MHQVGKWGYGAGKCDGICAAGSYAAGNMEVKKSSGSRNAEA